MPPIVLSLLTLLQYAPGAINEITALYNSLRHTFSPSDQATVDKALEDAKTSDAAATATGAAALAEAANH